MNFSKNRLFNVVTLMVCTVLGSATASLAASHKPKATKAAYEVSCLLEGGAANQDERSLTTLSFKKNNGQSILTALEYVDSLQGFFLESRLYAALGAQCEKLALEHQITGKVKAIQIRSETLAKYKQEWISVWPIKKSSLVIRSLKIVGAVTLGAVAVTTAFIAGVGFQVKAMQDIAEHKANRHRQVAGKALLADYARRNNVDPDTLTVNIETIPMPVRQENYMVLDGRVLLDAEGHPLKEEVVELSEVYPCAFLTRYQVCKQSDALSELIARGAI